MAKLINESSRLNIPPRKALKETRLDIPDAAYLLLLFDDDAVDDADACLEYAGAVDATVFPPVPVPVPAAAPVVPPLAAAKAFFS